MESPCDPDHPAKLPPKRTVNAKSALNKSSTHLIACLGPQSTTAEPRIPAKHDHRKPRKPGEERPNFAAPGLAHFENRVGVGEETEIIQRIVGFRPTFRNHTEEFVRIPRIEFRALLRDHGRVRPAVRGEVREEFANVEERVFFGLDNVIDGSVCAVDEGAAELGFCEVLVCTGKASERVRRGRVQSIESRGPGSPIDRRASRKGGKIKPTEREVERRMMRADVNGSKTRARSRAPDPREPQDQVPRSVPNGRQPEQEIEYGRRDRGHRGEAYFRVHRVDRAASPTRPPQVNRINDIKAPIRPVPARGKRINVNK